MFTKLYPRIRTHKNLTLAIPYLVRDKKVVSDNNKKLPHYFNIIQSHTSNHLSFYNLNKYKWWT